MQYRCIFTVHVNIFIIDQRDTESRIGRRDFIDKLRQSIPYAVYDTLHRSCRVNDQCHIDVFTGQIHTLQGSITKVLWSFSRSSYFIRTTLISIYLRLDHICFACL